MSEREPEVGADASPDPRCVVVVYVDGDDRRYFSTVADLAASSGRDVVVAAGDRDTLAGFAELAVETFTAASARDAIDAVWSKRRTHVFAVTDAVLVPGDAIERAERVLADDLRNATVSFLSNDAGAFSFPARRPTPAVPAGFDHQSLTRRLRASTPRGEPCPVPFACGGAVMLSDVALIAVGGLDVPPEKVGIDGCLADFSMRCRERGFVDLLDPETFVFRPPTPGRAFATEPMPANDRAWLSRRHPQLLPVFEQEESTSETPAALACSLARVKTFGLRVLVDDATLGPIETGAQITTLAIIDALAKHDGVQEVGVALSGHMPAYAKAVLGQPKVNVNLRVGGYAAFSGYDVLHRTAQPDKDFDVATARGAAARVVISILDLIAYRAGSYHASADDWLRYREVLRDAAWRADGITTISRDVATMLAREQIPVEPERVFPILYGTEHLSGHEPATFPPELAESGRLAGEFMVCVGTDYAHKNRDLAIAVHHELARRGRSLTLVLAGPSVPYGGSRSSERQRLRNDGDVVFLPALTARERNWLFRHAAVVLYPTSAEGFGLVPFEAARFGCPTVTVGFGPLLETSEQLPVMATSWDPRVLADCVEQLVADPVVRREQVSTTLRVADRYSWRRTAEEFLVMYRALIARPVR
jgi:glycosyltransferase involved in cell wall biosynthesis